MTGWAAKPDRFTLHLARYNSGGDFLIDVAAFFICTYFNFIDGQES
jgi:hypothetical protein